GLYSGIQSLAVFRVEIKRSDHDDWNVSPIPLPLQGGDPLKAIHLRHHKVEQDNVRFFLPEEIQRFLTVCSLSHDPLWTFKPSKLPRARGGIISDHQHARRSHRRRETPDKPVQPLAIDRLGQISS